MEPLLEKYRPKVFGDIVGHDHIITSLQEMLTNINEFPHVLFHGPQGTGKCIERDALVQLVDGSSKRICDIEAGDLVLSYDSDLKLVVNKVIKRIYTGKKKGYRMILEGGKIIVVSKEHPFLTGAYVKRKTLDIRWKDIASLDAKDLIGVPNRYLSERKDSGHPENFLNFLGFYLGDGTTRTGDVRFSNSSMDIIEYVSELLGPEYLLNKRGGIDYSVVFSGELSDETALKIIELYDSGIGRKEITELLNVTKGKVSYVLLDRDNHIYRKQVNPITDWLRDIDLYNRKSGNKFIPDFVFTERDNIRAMILTGLFMTDGSIGKEYVEFYTTSEQLAEGVTKLLLTFGIKSNLWKKVLYTSSIGYTVSLSREEDVIQFGDTITLFGEKQKKLDILIEKKRGSCYRGINYRYNINDVSFHRIKDIQEIGFVDMYDLEIENTHNFIANNIVVHNTTMMGALAKEIYKDVGDWGDIVLEINASEERNLATVRDKIIKYCKTASSFYDIPRKMVILEEADHFNVLSQPALRRPMEKFSRTTIFGLTCNYTRKIIPPLRSRCAMYRFVKATPEDIKTFITRVAGKEDISIEGEALELMALNSYGDFRTGLMAMQMATQRTTDGSRYLTAERLIELFNYITQESIDEIMNLVQESKMVEAVELADGYLASGVLPEMMLDAFYKYCRNKSIFQREEVGVQAIKLFVDTSKDISTSIIPAIAIDYLLMSLGEIL